MNKTMKQDSLGLTFKFRIGYFKDFILFLFN